MNRPAWRGGGETRHENPVPRRQAEAMRTATPLPCPPVCFFSLFFSSSLPGPGRSSFSRWHRTKPVSFTQADKSCMVPFPVLPSATHVAVVLGAAVVVWNVSGVVEAS